MFFKLISSTRVIFLWKENIPVHVSLIDVNLAVKNNNDELT